MTGYSSGMAGLYCMYVLNNMYKQYDRHDTCACRQLSIVALDNTHRHACATSRPNSLTISPNPAGADRDICENQCIGECQDCVLAATEFGYFCTGQYHEGQACTAIDGPGKCIAGQCHWTPPSGPVTCEDNKCAQCSTYAHVCDMCKDGNWLDMAAGRCYGTYIYKYYSLSLFPSLRVSL